MRRLLLAILLSCVCAAAAADLPVTLTQDDASYTLANGFVTAKIAKRSGDLVSLVYKGIETLEGGSGHPYAYWSHAGPGTKSEHSITIDPAANGGERAEISCRFFSLGQAVGRGPGGSAIADIEIRYAVGRRDSGVYTYSIFTHKPEYPAFSLGEARFAAKLNPRVFDYMTVDKNRRKVMIAPADWDQGTELNMKEVRRLNTGIYAGQVEHKYDYSAIQFEIPAFGWSSTARHIGLWLVNPSIEYLSGGATKVELTAHNDNNAGAAPTVLNYWRGSHYGGSVCDVAQGEAWTKVVGPFLIYLNSAPDGGKQHEMQHYELWKNALSQASREAAAWPYDWVEGVDFPHQDQRGAVAGQIVLADGANKMTNLLVGLADAAADWQRDAKHYEFWVRGDAQGRFRIPKVRPGGYTLHAIADGVLGEFAKTGVEVAEGKSLELGRLEWRPVRNGRQVWEIGVPNRSAEEFRHGDHYWQWGLYNEYPKEFPDDVRYVIGKSDWRRDWNYVQPPRISEKSVAPTTWSIAFEMPEAGRGKATLRLAFAGNGAPRGVEVVVNDAAVGGTGPLPVTGVMHRDGIRGYWFERSVPFDAGLLKAGTNVIKLRVPATAWTQGILYDYLRLEVE